MKICVIGNSHVASIRQGWDVVSADFPGVVMTFFAAKGTMLEDLNVVGGKLVPRNKKVAALMARFADGNAEISPQDYDAFVLIGLSLHVPRLPIGSSRALRRAAVQDRLTTSLMAQLISKLRSVTDKKIWITPVPMESDAVAVVDAPLLDYAQILSDVSAAVGTAGTIVLGQPLATVTPDMKTVYRFSNAAVFAASAASEDEAHTVRKGETRHMNAEFGALWLREFLPGIVAN